MINRRHSSKNWRFLREGAGRLWSPTYFERYGGCPFRFFLERVLHVYSLKIPAEEIERADEGSLIHTVLERFFTVQKGDNLLPIRGTEEEKDCIHKVADEVYRQWEEQGTTGNKDLWEIRKGRQRLCGIGLLKKSRATSMKGCCQPILNVSSGIVGG